MAIAQQASKLSLPLINPGVSTVVEYLAYKFSAIPSETWLRRVTEGKVHLEDGTPITVDSPFQPQLRIFYYREVDNEPVIPFEEKILFEDQYLLLAYKPHFLAVTPAGNYVNECLQNRLRHKTGNPHLQALHRIDRVTAGIVLFSKDIESRSQYHQLFETRQMDKTYQAIAETNHKKPTIGQQWSVKNRIEKSGEEAPVRSMMQMVNGQANSHSLIQCIAKSHDKALFELKPITGKTHQLRLHMQSLGWPILNDNFYPTVAAESQDDYSKPLQLLAKEIKFTDPITRQPRNFSCSVNLEL